MSIRLIQLAFLSALHISLTVDYLASAVLNEAELSATSPAAVQIHSQNTLYSKQAESNYSSNTEIRGTELSLSLDAKSQELQRARSALEKLRLEFDKEIPMEDFYRDLRDKRLQAIIDEFLKDAEKNADSWLDHELALYSGWTKESQTELLQKLLMDSSSTELLNKANRSIQKEVETASQNFLSLLEEQSREMFEQAYVAYDQDLVKSAQESFGWLRPVQADSNSITQAGVDGLEPSIKHSAIAITAVAFFRSKLYRNLATKLISNAALRSLATPGEAVGPIGLGLEVTFITIGGFMDGYKMRQSVRDSIKKAYLESVLEYIRSRYMEPQQQFWSNLQDSSLLAVKQWRSDLLERLHRVEEKRFYHSLSPGYQDFKQEAKGIAITIRVLDQLSHVFGMNAQEVPIFIKRRFILDLGQEMARSLFVRHGIRLLEAWQLDPVSWDQFVHLIDFNPDLIQYILNFPQKDLKLKRLTRTALKYPLNTAEMIQFIIELESHGYSLSSVNLSHREVYLLYGIKSDFFRLNKLTPHLAKALLQLLADSQATGFARVLDFEGLDLDFKVDGCIKLGVKEFIRVFETVGYKRFLDLRDAMNFQALDARLKSNGAAFLELFLDPELDVSRALKIYEKFESPEYLKKEDHIQNVKVLAKAHDSAQNISKNDYRRSEENGSSLPAYKNSILLDHMADISQILLVMLAVIAVAFGMNRLKNSKMEVSNCHSAGTSCEPSGSGCESGSKLEGQPSIKESHQSIT